MPSLQSCTYENWPRSIKCSMCGKTKEREISGSQNDLHASSSLNIQEEHQQQQQQSVDTVSVNNSFNKKHIYQLGKSCHDAASFLGILMVLRPISRFLGNHQQL